MPSEFGTFRIEKTGENRCDDEQKQQGGKYISSMPESYDSKIELQQ